MPSNTEHYEKIYKGVKLDPARIAVVYGISHPLQMMILKKILRAGEAHKDLESDLDDICKGIHRWKEMIQEDEEIKLKIQKGDCK